MKASRLFLFAFCGLIILSQSVSAFGFIEKEMTKKAVPGDTVDFEIYVFGTEGMLKTNLTSYPKNWTVTVDPDQIKLPVEENYRYIQKGGSYEKIRPVKVTVKLPESTTEPDINYIELEIKQVKDADSDQTLTVVRSQNFRFEVDITEVNQSDTLPKNNNQTLSEKIETSDLDANDSDSEQEREKDGINPILVVFLILQIPFLVVLYLIKRD